jgi:two-component system nitrogen regulation response regulator GlnG
MAPAQLIEPKDLPPEIGPSPDEGTASRVAPLAAEAPRAPAFDEPTRDGSAVRPEVSTNGSAPGWESGLEAEALELLASGRHDVWEALTKRFESKLILTALANTRGRRIEAAQKLGIGRNTITRKIQELGLE